MHRILCNVRTCWLLCKGFILLGPAEGWRLYQSLTSVRRNNPDYHMDLVTVRRERVGTNIALRAEEKNVRHDKSQD
jgi:hypothetical protein